jgi:HEPN domain-containing protein
MQNNLPADKIWHKWIEKANEDELSVESILKHRDGAPNTVGFLSQQIVEKYLKAFLVFSDKDYPKIHDLLRIASLIMPLAPEIADFKEQLGFLSRLYVANRYPDDAEISTWKEAENAFQSAREIKNFVIEKITARQNPNK